jgi:hypothetical protein
MMTCPPKPSAPMSLVAGLLALSSSAASAEPAASSRLIKCEGPFGRNAGHSDLVKAFGNKNVVEQEIDGAEGQKIKASVLYPADPTARLEFVWSDEKARRRPTLIRATDQSAWATTNGIRIGTALVEIEQMNGKPFKLRLRLGLRRQGHGLAGWHAEQAATRRLHPRGRFRPPRGFAGGKPGQGDRRRRVPLRQCRYARGRTVCRYGDHLLPEALIRV